MKGERGRPGLVNGVRLMVVAHGSFGNEHVSFGGERCGVHHGSLTSGERRATISDHGSLTTSGEQREPWVINDYSDISLSTCVWWVSLSVWSGGGCGRNSSGYSVYRVVVLRVFWAAIFWRRDKGLRETTAE